MKKLAYITDLASQPGGGGSYAVNWHIEQQLRKRFNVVSTAKITPKVSMQAKWISRVQRYVLHRPSDFFYFSPATLDGNAARVARNLNTDLDGVFFRSAARWCHSVPPVPYFVYLDIVFHTFFENTFRQKDFRAADLQRIYDAEARFLENASAVFFEADWGLQEARAAYGLADSHYHVAGRGGVFEPPERDEWTAESPYLLSIAMNFEQKGGDIILQAFRQLKDRHPELRWHVVGGRPTGDWQKVDGLVYEGVLEPAEEPDLTRFRQLLAQAFLLVHPTREDTSPLVLTEAAYFGCPSVTVNRFAIPELVLDGQTGVLLEPPVDPAELAAAIDRLIAAPEDYRRLRANAFTFARERFDWNRIGERMASEINARLQ